MNVWPLYVGMTCLPFILHKPDEVKFERSECWGEDELAGGLWAHANSEDSIGNCALGQIALSFADPY